MTKFEELLKNIHHKHVFIQTHNFPDPDAIASAYGLSMLLKSCNIDSTLCYSGRIDRHSTARMIELAGIEIYNINDLPSVTDDDEVILVDSQKGNSNIINMTGEEIICIDHHPTGARTAAPDKEYRFYDIRPEAGACASIIASYFYENNIPMDDNTATVLCFGIRMDTKGLSDFDMDMFYRVFKNSNHAVIQSLENSTLEFSDLKVYAAAINSIQVYGTASFANAGYNCPEALIASVSDFMLQLKEVDFSVVYSFRSDGVKLSIRSEDALYDAGVIASRALRDIGGGGGHASMAGGFIPYDRLHGLGKDDVEDISSIIRERFLHELA